MRDYVESIVKEQLELLKTTYYPIFVELFGEELVDYGYDIDYSNFITLASTNPIIKKYAGELDGQVSDLISAEKKFTYHIKTNKEFRNALKRRLFVHSEQSCAVLYILIKYPEITVTNENDRSTNIKDLYVKLTFHLDGAFRSMEGIRSTYNESEFNARYAHSHLPGKVTAGIFQNFCLGSGPISITLQNFRNTDFENFDADELYPYFCLLLAELNTYVQTESLEGGPYVKLATIQTGSIDSSEIMKFNDWKTIHGQYTQFAKAFLEDLKNFNVDLYVNNNSLLVLDFGEFHKEISKYIIDTLKKPSKLGGIDLYYDHYFINNDIIYIKRDKKNSYKSLVLENYLKLNTPYYLFDFKGKPIVLQVTNDLPVEDIETYEGIPASFASMLLLLMELKIYNENISNKRKHFII